MWHWNFNPGSRGLLDPLRSPLRTQVPVEEPIVSTDEVIFPLTVSLDKLPPSTIKAKVSRGGGAGRMAP